MLTWPLLPLERRLPNWGLLEERTAPLEELEGCNQELRLMFWRLALELLLWEEGLFLSFCDRVS